MDTQKPIKIAGDLFWANWMKEYNTRFNTDNKKYESAAAQRKAAAARNNPLRNRVYDPVSRHEKWLKNKT